MCMVTSRLIDALCANYNVVIKSVTRNGNATLKEKSKNLLGFLSFHCNHFCKKPHIVHIIDWWKSLKYRN